jgi:hypothetical protein
MKRIFHSYYSAISLRIIRAKSKSVRTKNARYCTNYIGANRRFPQARRLQGRAASAKLLLESVVTFLRAITSCCGSVIARGRKRRHAVFRLRRVYPQISLGIRLRVPAAKMTRPKARTVPTSRRNHTAIAPFKAGCLVSQRMASGQWTYRDLSPGVEVSWASHDDKGVATGFSLLAIETSREVRDRPTA